MDLDDINDVLEAAKGVKLDPQARELLGLLAIHKKQELEKLEEDLEQQDEGIDLYPEGDDEEGLAQLKYQILKNVEERARGAKRLSFDDLLNKRETSNENIGEWAGKIEHLKSAPEVYKYARELAKSVIDMGVGSEDGAIKKNQLNLIIGLPWDKSSEVKIDLDMAQKCLDDSHFGMEKIKERIIEYLAVQKRDPKAKGTILCFVGPPGVGKTTLSKAIAEATGRKFVSVALGGAHDEGIIRGHNPGYVGAGPGQILKKLKEAGVNNPLVLLDEIDKLGDSNYNGNPAYALLEVLDPSQNGKFVDHYLEDLPVDLSDVMFVTTANMAETIFEPLRDRLEIINLSSYTALEKLQIAKTHLVPKIMNDTKLAKGELYIRTATLQKVISEYTAEAGVRDLARVITKICRKVVRANTQSGQMKRVVLEPNMLESYLGAPKYLGEKSLAVDTVGHTMGLAYTSVGGCMLPIEVAISEGKGNVLRTGKLGDVIKESVDAAWSVVRSLVGKYNLTDANLRDKDVHVHFYEAATPKDGPSAGAAITTTMVSALGKMPVRKDVCMTGEITLLGSVMPIGGLKEKLIAAHRGGMKIAFIPKDNVPNLEDVPVIVLKELRVIPVSHISEILDIALVKPK